MRERGMVVVETAFAVMALAVVGSLMIAVAGAMFLQTQCQVTANEVARQAARGDRAAVERTRSDAPRGATVSTRDEGGAVVADVTLTARVGPLAWPIQAQARVLVER